MEATPDTTNVVYIDEYPELQKRVWLRRLAAERTGQLALFRGEGDNLIIFPTDQTPDGAA